MKLALIGLGRMGGNMAHRLIEGGHTVIGYDQSAGAAQQRSAEFGLIPATTLEAVVQQLEPPRVVWIMVPAGEPTETTISTLSDLLSKDDILVDGGNSNYQESINRAAFLAQKGIHFVDVGVSGGIWGLKEGYSMMVGGNPTIVEYLRPVFATLAPGPDRGWGYVGPHGAGHFVKMIHNGIEYGMMEAYAEGFELLRSRPDFALNTEQIAEIWRYGSVVRSWLLDLIAAALKDDPNLSNLQPWVADSGEGRWTVMEAIQNAVPAPVIALALFRRFESRQTDSYADKLLAAMRNEFGGHPVKTVQK
jgi:6-phosphogluconate dehydrogenase